MNLENSERLVQHLGDQWRVTRAPFRDFRGVIQSLSPYAKKPFLLQLAADLSEQEMVYMVVHAVSHQWLGDLQQSTIILESKKIESNRQNLIKVDPKTIEQHRRSDILTEIILADQIDERWGEVLKIDSDREGLLYSSMSQVRRVLGSQKYPFIGQDKW